MRLYLTALLALVATSAVAEEDVVACFIDSRVRCDAEGCKRQLGSDALSDRTFSAIQFKKGAYRVCKARYETKNCKEKWYPIDEAKKDRDAAILTRHSSIYRVGRTFTETTQQGGNVFMKFGTCEGNFKSLVD